MYVVQVRSFHVPNLIQLFLFYHPSHVDLLQQFDMLYHVLSVLFLLVLNQYRVMHHDPKICQPLNNPVHMTQQHVVLLIQL